MRRHRLKLLTEVLPAPPAGSPQGDPRERTLKRLGRLLTAAAAAAAVGACKHNDDGGSSGYGVVDPMPAPPQCDGLARTIRAEARFTSPNTLLITLGAPGMNGAAYKSSSDPMSETLRIVRKNVQPMFAEIEVEVPPNATVLAVALEATCPLGDELLHVAVTSAIPNGVVTPAAPLNVNLTDSEW